ncbi:hypothetical protein F5Y10DRAFT_287806 [Nemania abortiva]|nr:hypothetical protein F5Y10DRAFT_287806 [Nemania abortiva]
MDEHLSQEADRGEDQGSESSISIPSTPPVNTNQQPRPNSPLDLAIYQARSEGINLFARSTAPEISPTINRSEQHEPRRSPRQFAHVSGGERGRFPSPCSTVAAAIHSFPAALPAIQPSPQTPASSRPQAPIPTATATTTTTTTTTATNTATATAAPAVTTATAATQAARPYYYSAAATAGYAPPGVSPLPFSPAPFTSSSFAYYPSIHATAPRAYLPTTPWPQHPARPRTAPSWIPSYPVLNINPRAPFVMAAPNGWSPMAQSLFCPPPQLQQPLQALQPQQQQYWYYYTGATPTAGLPVTCTRPSPFWSGTSHYLTNPPPQAPQVYTVEPAYIMPQATYYQAPAATPIYYYNTGAPTYYYPS